MRLHWHWQQRLSLLACRLACALFFLFQPAWAVDSGPRRLALVIGNDAYQSVEPLTNARNDAKLISGVLKRAGFDVTLVTDVARDGFWTAIDTFKGRIAKGDEVVFYFAGHGVQIASNQLLLPVDIKAQNDQQVQRDGVSLVDVQDALKDARFAMFVIDACRDNPFPKHGTRAIGTTRGLLPPEPATGQVIIMSAGRNQKALDSVPGVKSDNGLFTYELSQVISQPGMEIRAVLESVKEEVDDRAKKVNHEQRPSLVNDLRGNFYFFGPTTIQLNAVAPEQAVRRALAKTPEQIEDEAWDAVKNSAEQVSLEEYLRQYPKGRYVGQARIAVAKMKADAKRLASSAVAPIQPVAPVAAPSAAKVADAETTFWLSVEAGRSADDYALYIQQYPKGAYVVLARQRLQKLNEEAALKAKAEEAVALQKAEQLRNEEFQAWDGVRKRRLRKEIASYLERYPAGSYAPDARTLLSQLTQDALDLFPGKVFRDCADCPDMVVIPEGSFMMGGTGDDDQKPVHAVSVPSFAMGKTPVTQGQWIAVMGSNPSKYPKCGADCPVDQVNWNDTQEFIRKLNALTGQAYRLPSEAEWEYSCRAGGRHQYCGSDNPDSIAWYPANSEGAPHPVASKQANAFGLFDMSGNVWQWVEDWKQGNYVGAPTDGSAWTAGAKQRSRVLRGGSWSSNRTGLLASSRNSSGPDNRYDDDGFRVAMTLASH